MGEGNKVASVILFTFTLKPHAHKACLSCVGRLCKDYLYLYNSLPLIPTPPLIMAVNIGEAVCCPLPS